MRLRHLSDPDSLPALDKSFAIERPALGLAPDAPPVRILLLYGSLRARSFSRLAVEEAARLLQFFGAETRIFDPSDLPLPDQVQSDDHPAVKELRALSEWSEGQVWCSPERHGQITSVMKLSISSLDDIFNNDDLGLFNDITSDILVSDSKTNGRARSNQYEEEEIATRFECVDFYKFEPTFERIYHAIQTGAFTKTNSTSFKSIAVGSVFVLNGLLCYVADIYKAEARKDARSQERLRLIFANGTESNMLTHSLATAQYKYENSYQLLITDPDWMDDELAKNFGDKKHLSGVIYVAKLTDTPDNLKHYKHLHKIGFSTLTGEMRAKHSIKDTAFLQQPVDIIAEWQIYDANARSVESVLHAFFYDQRVRMSTKAADEKLYRATEWFNVPLSEIEKAIGLVISGDIKHYIMDAAAGRIVPK